MFLRARFSRSSASFTSDEWDAYIAAGMAIQDERGAVSLAHRKGVEQGLEEGLRTAITDLCEVLGITPTPAQQLASAGMDARALGALREQLERERRFD